MSPAGRLLVVLVCWLSLAACENRSRTSDCGARICVEDFAGNSIALDKPAERIIAMSPHLVENVFSAGAGDKLIAVFEHSNYPEAAQKLPIVGGFQRINIERILELQPDLILAWQSGNSQAAIKRLIELGFTVYLDEPKTIADVARSVRNVGQMAGTSKIADAAASEFIDRVRAIQKQYAGLQPVRVFYQVWNQPLQTVNGDSLISEALRICGGTNIYADQAAIAPVINIESVLKLDPQAVIAGGVGRGRPTWLDEWQQWPSLTATRNGHLFHVNPDYSQRHTLRLQLGIEAICGKLDRVREKRAAQ